MYRSIKLLSIISVLFLAACGDNDSSSGGEVDVTIPGDMLPANFIGTYTGTLNLRASAAGISQADTVPITVTVMANGTVRFSTDDPDEAFTVGINNQGSFSGVADIVEDPCQGTINVAGSVNGSVANGTVQGDGSCNQGGLNVDVELSGDFTANK